MRSLRLHTALYDRESLDQTVAAFAGFGTIRVSDEPEGSHWRVDVETTAPEALDEVSGSFSNYVLTLSIERRRRPNAQAASV